MSDVKVGDTIKVTGLGALGMEYDPQLLGIEAEVLEIDGDGDVWIPITRDHELDVAKSTSKYCLQASQGGTYEVVEK